MEHKIPISEFIRFPFALFASFSYKMIGRKKGMSSSILKFDFINRWGILCFAFLSISIVSWGQVNGDYQTRASGNWSNNVTWQVYSGGWVNCAPGDYPGVTIGAGTVTIRNSHAVTLNVDPANTIGALNFENNTVAATSLDITGRTLNVTGAVTFGAPSANAGDQTLTLGTGTLNCASVFMPNTGALNFDLLITCSTGIINVTGNILMVGANDRNNITFTGAGAINVGGNFTGGGFNCGTSTVNYNGTTQNVGAYTYNNLTISGSNNKTLQGNVNVNNNLAVNSGTFDFSNAGVRTVTVLGNLSGAGTIDMASGGSLPHQLILNGANNAISNFTCGSGTVIYSGALVQQIFAGTYYNLTTQTSNQVRTIQGDIDITNNLTITSGTFDFGNTIARNVSVGGNLSGAGTLNMSGAALAHNLNLAGVNNSIGTFNTTGGSNSTVNYNLLGDQQVFVSANYQNVNIAGSGNKTMNLGGPVTVNGNLDIVSGSTLTFDNSAARVLNIFGNLSGDGTIDMGTVPAQTHTMNLGGALNFIGALNTAPVASTVNYNRNGDQQVFASQNYRNIAFSTGGIKTLQGDITVGGTAIITASTLNFGLTDRIVVVNGNFNLTSGGLDMSGATNHQLNLRGATNTYTAGVFTPGGANQSVDYSGDLAQSMMPLTYRNLIVSNYNAASVTNRTKTVGGITSVTGDLTVNGLSTSLTTLQVGNADFSINGNTNIIDYGVFNDNNNAGTNTFAGLLTLNGSGSFTTTAVTTAANEVFQGGISLNGTGNFAGAGATFNTNIQNIIVNSTGNLSFLAANTVIINENTLISGAGAGTSAFGVMTIADTKTFTNQRTLTINGVLNGAGGTATFLNDINSTLIYTSATAPMVTGVLNTGAAGNVFNYSRGGAQSVKANVYSNLTISTSGIKTLSGAVTVNDLLTISAGTLADGGFVLIANKNIVNNGAHTGVGSIQLSGGTVAHNISGTGTFTNLNLNDSFGASLGSNTVINGTLTLTDGLLTILGNDLTVSTIGGAPGATKMIIANGIGQVKRNFVTGASAFTFPVGDNAGNYTPVILSFTANATAGLVGLNLKNVKHPANTQPDNYINRYWSITAPLLTTYTYSASFNYVATDVVGTGENTFLAQRFDNGTTLWTTDLSSSTNSGAHIFTTGSLNESTGKLNNNDFTSYKGGIDLYYWSKATGNWNGAATWEVSTTPADPGVGLGTPTAVIPTYINNNGITIRNTNNVTINAAGFTADQLNVSNGATLTLGANNLTLYNGTGSDIIVGATGTISTTTGQFIAAEAGVVFDINGTFTTSDVDGFSGTANTSIANNNAPVVNLNSGSTVNYNLTGQTITNAVPYDNLTNASTGTNAAGGNLIINGNLTLSTGIFAVAANTVNLSGNLVGAGTITYTSGTLNIAGNNSSTGVFTAGTGTVNYNGINQIVRSNSAYYNLNISNSGIKTFGATTPVTITGSLDILNSTLAYNAVPQIVNLTGNLSGNGTIDMSSGGALHALNLAGASNTIGALNTAAAASTVSYTRAGDQTVFGSPNYRNLTISGGGNKILQGSISLGNTLTLTQGVLRLDGNDLTLTNTTAVAGAPFGITKMIETSGTGRFIRSANTDNINFNLTYPVGSGGYYNPLIITGLPSLFAGARSLSVRAVPTNLGVFTNSINKYWDLTATNITTNGATMLSFAYNAGEVVGDPLVIRTCTNTSGTWAYATGPSAPGANPATSTGSATLTGFWTVGASGAFYSYQTGNWNQSSTWTTDPGGSTGPGTTVPGLNDKVVILSGRTVTLSSDVTDLNLDVTINGGGILDQSSFRFTSTLAALRGDGILKLSSSNFPAATINTFVSTDGGTTEYNNNGPMSAIQGTYYHLTIRTPGTVMQVLNATLNGNLDVKQGIFQINDATTRRLRLIINGNVTVDNGCSITVGTGVTNSRVSPNVPVINGLTGGFLNYYELQSHRVQVYGNFTNNGTVRFSNLANPVYNSFPPIVTGPTSGFATVYFQGSSDNILTCNGITDFYNLVLDKGADQTFKLTVISAAYNYFRLFGANISAGDNTLPATTANPNLKKALWIRTGTLDLQGLVAIPSLSEGATAGPPSSDFFIPANGALTLNGAGVIVLSTADDFTEINAAYGIAGGSNAAYGINTTGGYSGLSVLGKLQINTGYLSTRESSGLLYWSYNPGQFIMNGGKVDVKQFHNPEGGANGLISYALNGGNFVVRGRFTNTINYINPSDLANTIMNTGRAANNTDPAAGIGSFSINNNAANAFTMSGGILSVYDVCNTTATPLAFLVNSPASNINVTGGTVQIIPTTGTILLDANYLINSTAPFNNLILNRISGAASVQLNTNPLVIINDLTLTSGVFLANNLDVTVGGNFSLANGTTYTTGTNTTVFNGTANQTFTVNLAAALSLNNLSLNKTAGIAVNLAGTQSAIDIAGNFRLVLGTLNDNGKTLNVAGNVFNSGIHSGTGKIVLNGTLTQSIDGNGIFGNLELNNTNAATAPVSLAANMTLNGLLTFSQDKLLNISTYNIKLNSTSFIANGGPLRYIKSAGNAGDGGLTKVYSSPATFMFPVGVVNYTPASIGLSAPPTAYGSITVIPVNFAHPNVTTAGRSLTYFWRVKSSGFTLGAATVTQEYTYDQSNVVTGVGITENEYVAARFNTTTSTWTNGTTADIDIVNNLIGGPGSGTFLKNVTFIDGDYTAGDNNPINPFGTATIYYSRINGAASGSGLWSNVNTWSTDGVLKHTGAPAASVPGVNDIVIIGALDSVYLATNLTVPNTDSRSCASLKIEKGSALDIGYNPSSNFGMVLNHANGNGNFRLTTDRGPLVWTTVRTFQFPLGDFSEFNVNFGTTELYTTNPVDGTTFYLPNGVISYGNLIISPLGGSNIIFANNDLTVYGNLITRGQNADSWFCPSWNTNYPTPPAAVIAKTITVNGDLDIQGGGFIWYGNGGIAQNVVVNGNVKVGTFSALYVWSLATNQRMSIGGNLINNTNGIINPPATQTISKVDFSLIPVTFFGSTSTSISNTGGTPVTIFSTVTVNKGTSQATTLTLDIGSTLTTPADNWLTLQNGTFRYRRTNPSTDFTVSTLTPFTIPTTSGLYIDLPSNTGNRNILIGNANNDNGDLLLSGKLTLVNGNVYIGRTPGTDPSNNDIEYSSSGISSIDVQGGTLIVNGQIRRNPLNAGGVLKYSQSGGTVRINGQGSNATNAKLEVLNGGSDFTMSNGTLTIVRGNGATVTPSSPFGDLYLRPETSNVSGGTIVFSQGALTSQNYFLDANVPLNNLTITGAAGQPAVIRLLVSPLILNGNMTINANSVFNSNNINVTFNGNLINTPGVGGYVAGTNLTTFSATNGGPFAGAQTITGATNFYNLVINPGSSLTIGNPSTVSKDLTLSTGTLICGGNAVTVIGDVINDAGYTDNNAVGSGLILNGATLQHITGFGAYSRLTLNNPAGVSVENNITLQEDLTMTLGILDINKNLLSLGVNSLIQGAPFSATKMITSDGVFSNVGLRKFFNPGATVFLYPIGTSGKYTPALLTVTASNTVGYVRINNINSRHPAILDPANALDYYWEVQSSGITGFTGSLVLNYLQGDVVGAQENNYMAARMLVPGTSWSLTAGVDPVLNKITTNYITSNNLSGEYTAGVGIAFPANVPIYTSNANGNWTDQTIWTQTGGDPYPCPPGGPNGFIVNINHIVTLNANYCSAYRTTINNRLQVTSSFYGHNLGTVNGNGTLYLESGTLPAGVYTSFIGCSNFGTVEYGGSGTYTIIADLYDDIHNIVFSGTGTRVLPDKDLIICNQLKIDGPTLDNSVYNKKLTIRGTMERYNSGAFKSGNGAGATISFAGTSTQTIGGALGNFIGTNAFNNFEINNNAGLSINDPGAIEVTNNLLLTNGLINTGATKSLTISNSSINCVIPAGGSAGSFVNGPLIKRISQYDSFLFPIGIYLTGPGNILGNNIKISSPQSGPLLWSAEYKSPNGTAASFTAPLLGVSSQEFYTVKTAAGSQATLNINWVPTSDVTPLITGGIANIRLANYNTGSSSWVEIPTTSAGNNFNGTATSTGFVTYTGTDNYTLGSITTLKPRAKLSPTGPVCGAAGIPVTFTYPGPIPFDYTLTYTINGAAQTPITITSGMVPYTLPTLVPGDYKLTGFTYNSGASNGVVDASIVTAYNVPTTSNAGLDQTLCGITSVILNGNTPAVGSGLWSIVSGSGGTLIAPSNPSSQFIGLNGVSYTLRWTITNGSCLSSDDVVINFTILPNPPAASPNQSFCGSATIANLVATPPVGCTVDWYSAASAGVLLPPATALVSGTTYYAESNGGCVSLTRTAVLATINPVPVPGLVGPNLVCIGSTGNVYSTEAGKTNYVWSVIGGFITAGGLGTDNTATVTWNVSGPQTIRVNYQGPGGCTAASPTVFNVTVTVANSAGAASSTPTLCVNTPLTPITHATTGATGIGAAAGLPAGVTAVWAANVITISGTPTATGVFNYTIPLTGGCGAVDATGTITVAADVTVGAASSTPTLCINTLLTSITHATTGATGIGAAAGLPAGVTAVWAANVITISGTPTAAGVFNYTIPLTGGCGAVNATGTITVTADMTVGAASSTPALCINTVLTSITHATTGATGIGAAAGLPAGVTAVWAANVITISGTPTATGVFNYTIPLTGGCGAVNATGTITVTADMTVGAASSTPTLCINTVLTSITHATTGATGIGAAAGLPAGVTAVWAANVITISGTPTAAGVFNYTIPLTGGCGAVNATGAITVTADNTAGAASSTPTLCINTILTSITHATTGATGIGAAAGLPAGVTAVWAANVITISGTPTSAGVFNYTIPLTGGCGAVNATGTITVTADMTVGAASSTPTLCINTVLTSITHATTGATGIGAAAGLPAGVTAAWAANVITISGTPTAAGVFNYTIPLTGGCGAVNATGTITVTADNSAGAASSTPTLCINTALTPITHATTGATGIGAAAGLPAGVTAVWAANVITISGTPTATGVFNYTIPLTGGCGAVNATGTITVTADNSAGAASSTPTLCINTALTPITHATTGATGIGAAAGLPAGVTAVWAANVITISGTPTATGVFNYTIPLTGGCGAVDATGTITVTTDMTVGAASSTPTLCINTLLTSITHATTGATGIGAAAGLPAGVTAVWAANVITISGTPRIRSI